MTQPTADRVTSPRPAPPPDTAHPDTRLHEHDRREHPTEGTGGHGRHRLMMIACCVPMLVIVGVLVATGVAGSAAIIYAIVCLGAMAVMMLAMPGGRHH
ncbi:hypothetical protein [Cellulomonas fimi]|uniref:Uncharacterized protein n=1 Tax=Cellulomonas fimi TaxID=1708 RepID=A0A7Y0M0W6_CELFI|nr:hypothetical protein [Cellulomonas fimi]NMR21576.1 hypothetical protein [Cellulomonas fimi]